MTTLTEFEHDINLLAATKDVAEKEEVMYEKQEAYEAAYGEFKLAQQHLFDMQRAWIRRDNEKGDSSKQVLATESDVLQEG